MPQSHSHYEQLEHIFTALLDSMTAVLHPDEIAEVRTYIDVGEYGVALETLVAIIIDENKQISGRAVTAIEDLAHRMDMEAVMSQELRDCSEYT
jgi:hypothetical protein